MQILKRTLVVIGAVQIVLGVTFLIPGAFETVMGLDEAPDWTNWILVMFGARAIGFGYGMLRAAVAPEHNRDWIRAMIGIQAIDWIGTIAYLVAGQVTLAQVTTVAFLPLIFIAVLTRGMPQPATT